MKAPDDAACPAESDLLPLATGDELLAETKGRLESHVAGCPTCRDRLERMRSSVRDLRGLEGPAPGPAADEHPAAIGKYRVVGLLGKGGQAEVYRVVHPALEKELVLKLARRRTVDDPSLRSRLAEEGKLLAGLDHPALARVYDLDLHDGRPFLVLEFVRGRSLAQVAREETLTHRRAARLVAELARALGAAHRRGVVHQDLKPENIVIDAEGRPRVIDFGLARFRHAWAPGGEEPGTVSGTVQYMAPEQARGETERIGPRSDVFALGAVLYSLLAGKAPFEAETPRAPLERAQRCDFDRAVLRARGVPRRLERTCLKAMEARPEDRHARAEELAAELESFARRRWLAVVACALVCLAAMAWALSPAARPRPEEADRAAAAASGGAAAIGIQLAVTRGADSPRLADALPLRNGDEIRVRFETPAGLEVALFWLDTEGKLHDLPAVEAGGEGSGRAVVYPRPGFTVPLEGPPGTELILACGRAKARPRSEDVSPLLGSGGPWPPLPDGVQLRIDREGARLQGPRGPGAPKPLAGEPLRRAETLRVELSRRFDWFAGVAFPHGE
ncbi:MAG: protein kinase [Planctomycetes bacterium]|nr:protein kinase [Planctomycetota bacterium]